VEPADDSVASRLDAEKLEPREPARILSDFARHAEPRLEETHDSLVLHAEQLLGVPAIDWSCRLPPRRLASVGHGPSLGSLAVRRAERPGRRPPASAKRRDARQGGWAVGALGDPGARSPQAPEGGDGRSGRAVILLGEKCLLDAASERV